MAEFEGPESPEGDETPPEVSPLPTPSPDSDSPVVESRVEGVPPLPPADYDTSLPSIDRNHEHAVWDSLGLWKDQRRSVDQSELWIRNQALAAALQIGAPAVEVISVAKSFERYLKGEV